MVSRLIVTLKRGLSPGKTAVAVITPYPSQGLPSAEGLAHISGNARLTLSAIFPEAILIFNGAPKMVECFRHRSG